MANFDLLAALAGLGLFVFAMNTIESAIKTVTGSQFKIWLRKSTDSNLKAILTGTIVTAVLQSSTLVSLMVLAFVGANLLTLKSAIGIIFGANIGSTGVSWIITLFGFKAGASMIALPLIALAGLGVLFSSQKKRTNAFFTMIMGFGLLFFGLDMMKNSIQNASEMLDLDSLKAYGFFAYIAIGMILTLIIRSSAASMAIFLSAIDVGAIDFYTASMLAIGAHIGTTGTVLISSIGGTADKKRVASSHLIFNLMTALVVLIIYKPLVYFLLTKLGLDSNLTLALTLFFTIFSLLGVVLFAPFIGHLERFLLTKFKSKETKSTRFIDTIDPALSDAAVEALKNETIHLFREVMRFSLLVFNIPPKEIFLLNKKSRSVVFGSRGVIDIDIADHYSKLQKLESDMLTFAAKIGDRTISDDKLFNQLLQATKELLYIAKIYKDIKHNIDEFATTSDQYMLNFYNEARVRVAKIFKYLFIVISKSEEFDSEVVKDKLKSVLIATKEEDKNTLATITKAIKNGDISQYSSPMFITINRSVVNASNALIEVASLLDFDK